MLTNDDLKLIRGVLKEELDQRFEDQAFLMNLSFQEVQNQFAQTNARIDRVENKMDGFLKMTERLDHELVATNARVTRLCGT